MGKKNSKLKQETVDKLIAETYCKAGGCASTRQRVGEHTVALVPGSTKALLQEGEMRDIWQIWPQIQGAQAIFVFVYLSSRPHTDIIPFLTMVNLSFIEFEVLNSCVGLGQGSGSRIRAYCGY